MITIRSQGGLYFASNLRELLDLLSSSACEGIWVEESVQATMYWSEEITLSDSIQQIIIPSPLFHFCSRFKRQNT